MEIVWKGARWSRDGGVQLSACIVNRYAQLQYIAAVLSNVAFWDSLKFMVGTRRLGLMVEDVVGVSHRASRYWRRCGAAYRT